MEVKEKIDSLLKKIMDKGYQTYCGNSLFGYDLWKDTDKLDFLMFVCREGFITKSELDEIKRYYYDENISRL